MHNLIWLIVHLAHNGVILWHNHAEWLSGNITVKE